MLLKLENIGKIYDSNDILTIGIRGVNLERRTLGVIKVREYRKDLRQQRYSDNRYPRRKS